MTLFSSARQAPLAAAFFLIGAAAGLFRDLLRPLKKNAPTAFLCELAFLGFLFLFCARAQDELDKGFFRFFELPALALGMAAEHVSIGYFLKIAVDFCAVLYYNMKKRAACTFCAKTRAAGTGRCGGLAKAKKKSSFLRVLVVLLLVGLLASFGYYLIKQSLVLSQQEAQIARMQEENARLEDEYRKVLEKIDDKSTVEFVEQYMRSHFGMIRNGETRIDVVEGE